MDPVELTQKLIALDTINPPGHEARAADLLVPLLEEAGFRVDRLEMAPGRPNLIARSAGEVKGPWLVFTGHLDTVPPGEVAWSRPPLQPAVEGDRLFGRGSSDMKSGLAAMTAAAVRLTGENSAAPIMLVYTAAEETGCEGAAALTPLLPAYGPAGALVVGEPTANLPYIGHKGVLWLRATAPGPIWVKTPFSNWPRP